MYKNLCFRNIVPPFPKVAQSVVSNIMHEEVETQEKDQERIYKPKMAPEA